MRLPRVAFLVVLSTASLFAAEPAGLEFSGILTDGEKARFALTDKSNNQTTWLSLGEEFNGYTVTRYAAGEETVTLKRGLEEFTLRLIVAKSPESLATNPGALGAVAPDAATDAAVGTIRNNLRVLAVAARRHQLDTGATTTTFADLVGPDKYIKEVTPVAGENYAGLTFGPGAANLSVTTANGVTVTVDTGPALVALASSTAGQNAGSAAPATTAPTEVEAASPLTPTGATAASHTVRPGETLATIAEAAGVSEDQIKSLNPDLNPSSLRVGQPIRIR